MKKVLVIAPYSYLPSFSGGQKLIAQFLEWLGKETELMVITVAENDFSLAKNYSPIPWLKKKFSRYLDLSLVSKISTLIKKERFDTIIWEHPYYAWLASRIKNRTAIQTILHTHNIEYQRFRSTGRWWWPLLKIYEKWSFKKADALFFITPEDRDFAINIWKIKKEKCIDLPFGVEINNYPKDRLRSRSQIQAKHCIAAEKKIFLFNGLLDYKPNLDALKAILNEINPLLLSRSSFAYTIIICGKRLPDKLNDLKDYAGKNIIYAGFVDDITLYLKAADLFLNPIQSGGGVKTKMVEAIAYGDTVVSTQTGAVGMDKTICGEKLIIVPDNNWKGFADAIIANKDFVIETPQEYYNTYYWQKIIRRICYLINN